MRDKIKELCPEDWDKEKFYSAWKLLYEYRSEKYNKEYFEEEILEDIKLDLGWHTLGMEWHSEGKEKLNEKKFYNSFDRILKRAMTPKLKLNESQKRVLCELQGIDYDELKEIINPDDE